MLLKDLIKSKKKSQQEIANELGVHQTLISQWCHGKSRPSITDAAKLAKILGVSLETIAECAS